MHLIKQELLIVIVKINCSNRRNAYPLIFFVLYIRGVISFLLLLCLLGTLIDLYHNYRVSHIPKLVHRIDSTGSFFCKIHKENQVAKNFTWWASLISSLTLALIIFFGNRAFLFTMGAFFPSLTLVPFFSFMESCGTKSKILSIGPLNESPIINH